MVRKLFFGGERLRHYAVMLLLCFLLVVSGGFGYVGTTNVTTGMTGASSASVDGSYGMLFFANKTGVLYNVTLNANLAGVVANVLLCENGTLVASYPVGGVVAAGSYTVRAGSTYVIFANQTGNSRIGGTVVNTSFYTLNATPAAWHLGHANPCTAINYSNGGSYTTYNIESMNFSIIQPNTFSINNSVNGTNISGFCINLTNSNYNNQECTQTTSLNITTNTTTPDASSLYIPLNNATNFNGSATDQSPNNLRATLNGKTLTHGQFVNNPLVGSDGITFNNSHIYVPAASLNTSNVTNVYIRYRNLTNYPGTCLYTSADTYHFVYWRQGQNDWQAYFYNGSHGVAFRYVPADVDNPNWTTDLLSFDRITGNLSVYRNGNSVPIYNYPNGYSELGGAPGGLYIGNSPAAGPMPCNYTFGGMRLWTGAPMTSLQAVAEMNSVLPVRSDGLILSYANPLLANSTTVADTNYLVNASGSAAYSFDGVNDYLTTGVRSIPNGSFTISFWTYKIGAYGGANTYRGIMSQNYNIIYERAGTNFGMYYNSTNHDSGVSVDTGVPNHFVIVKNSTHIAFYKNGAYVTAVSETSNTCDAGDNFEIGRYYQGSTYFNGSIRDLHVYSFALSAREVLDVYRGQDFVSGSYNVTFSDVGSGDGNQSNAQYFNTSITNMNVDTIASGLASTSQALINVTAKQLYTNASIGTFNVTNSLAKNQTAAYYAIVPANNGSNNLKVDVPGNYSQNYTCTVSAPLTTAQCTATGVYDTLYTIGGSYSGVGVRTFNVSVRNETLGGTITSDSTNNGSTVFSLLQGYYYTFLFTPTTNYSVTSATLLANTSTQLYNFTTSLSNTLVLSFYNESTNAPLAAATNVSLQVVGGSYNINTTCSISCNVTLGVPDNYTITYYLDPAVPRNYYTSLIPQSQNTIRLYIVDTNISAIYTPIIVNENTVPQGGVTVSLYRYFINNDNTGSYQVVEMEQTDTNGQAVLRVVPNTIPYKLGISKGSTAVVTSPTRFTTSSNYYTINQQANWLQAPSSMPGVQRSITYNNATLTFTLTWQDNNNVVTGACLDIAKTKLGVYTASTQCQNGSAGSLTYTVTDTNSTSYNAYGRLTTGTISGDYGIGPSTVDFSSNNAWQIFGLLGWLFSIIVITSIVMMANTMGTRMTVVGAVIGLVLMGAFGFIAPINLTGWFLGLIVVVGVILYKIRS